MTATISSACTQQPLSAIQPIRQGMSGIDKFFGGLFGGFMVLDLYFLGLSRKEYVAVKQLNPSEAGVAEKLAVAKKSLALSTLSITGTTSWMLFWGHQIKQISLGGLLPFISGLAYGSIGLSASFRGVEAYRTLTSVQKALKNAPESEEAAQLKCKRNVAFLKVVYNTLSVAWAILGILPMVAGIIIPAALSFGIALAGLLLAIVAVNYEITHLPSQQTTGHAK
jgi:hypothetical protein